MCVCVCVCVPHRWIAQRFSKGSRQGLRRDEYRLGTARQRPWERSNKPKATQPTSEKVRLGPFIAAKTTHQRSSARPIERLGVADANQELRTVPGTW